MKTRLGEQGPRQIAAYALESDGAFVSRSSLLITTVNPSYRFLKTETIGLACLILTYIFEGRTQ